MARGITIVGLGPGDPGLLTRAAWDALDGAADVYLRSKQAVPTDEYPIAACESFDSYYEQHDSCADVYVQIVDRLLELADRPQGVVYAVPGDPNVGEATVTALRKRAPERGLPLKVVPGLSSVSLSLDALGLDALDHLAVADALELADRYHPSSPPDCHLIVAQMHSKLVAGNVKLTLLNQYPPDHVVWLVRAVGTPEQQITSLALHELDRQERYDPWTSLYVPPRATGASFESLHNTVARLRAPDGCPWDREQTHESLRQHLLEEAYEVLDALDKHDSGLLREELGDLMLQLVMQVQIATEYEEFQMADILGDINSKLIRRHPHVFGSVDVDGAEEVLRNWEALKAKERADRGNSESALDGVPDSLPALAQADEFQSRAGRLGFDWPDRDGVLDKLREELGEVEAAETEEEQARELGDVLFTLANYARWLGVDPESALRGANRRFYRRFQHLELAAESGGRPLNELSLDELNQLWAAAKREVG
jgi:tetrapyrrole methylase family protein/MazG family protein